MLLAVVQEWKASMSVLDTATSAGMKVNVLELSDPPGARGTQEQQNLAKND